LVINTGLIDYDNAAKLIGDTMLISPRLQTWVGKEVMA
jgi:hypothetical protein